MKHFKTISIIKSKEELDKVIMIITPYMKPNFYLYLPPFNSDVNNLLIVDTDKYIQLIQHPSIDSLVKEFGFTQIDVEEILNKW